MNIFAPLVAVILLALPAGAQEPAQQFRHGADSFAAGEFVVFETADTDDLFLAGETVRVQSSVSGAAHLAGRRVQVNAPVGGNLYGAGMDVLVTAGVEGNATLAGYEVVIDAPVDGNLRAAGSDLRVNSDIGGTALLGGESIAINGVISGDAAIAPERLSFGEGARIEGALRLYAEADAEFDIPESVIPAERITRHEIEEWEGIEPSVPHPSWLQFIGGVLVVAALAALLAAVAPEGMAAMRRRLLARPFGTLGYGFLTLSALIGAAVVFAVTIVGIFLSPAALLIAALASLAGYVIGAYSFGAGVLIAVGRGEPAGLGQRVIAAVLGAVLVALIALIPLLGWIFVVLVTLAGMGTLTLKLLRPAFFATPGAP